MEESKIQPKAISENTQPCNFIMSFSDTIDTVDLSKVNNQGDNNLYLGGINALTHQQLSKHKISAVLTIMTEKQKKKGKLDQKIESLDEINRHNTFMCEQDYQLAPYFNSAIQFINDSFMYKMNVLVHCKEGDSKSAILVIAYLIYKFKISDIKALEIVKKKRPYVKLKESYLYELQESVEKLHGMK